MCSGGNSCRNRQVKCMTLAFGSLVVHLIISLFSTTVLIMTIHKVSVDPVRSYLNQTIFYFENMDTHTFLVLCGILLGLGVLGMSASVMLIIGLKYERPGFVMVYFCYGVQTCIVLLIGSLLLGLNFYWAFAIATLCVFALTAGITISVYNIYDVMVQEALLKRKNSISDLTLLIEDVEDNLTTPAG